MYISPKPISDYPWYLRWNYRSQKKKWGTVLLPGLIWGRIPILQILFQLFWRYLDRKSSVLDPALRALVQVRVAQMNWCNFCIDFNALNLLKITNSTQKAENLDGWKTHEEFSDVERVALEYAEVISGSQVKVPTELMERLKLNFSDDQVVELTALISFQNMSAKFNAALDIPSQGLCNIHGKIK